MIKQEIEDIDRASSQVARVFFVSPRSFQANLHSNSLPTVFPGVDVGKYKGTVLECVLWYRSAIVLKEACRQYGAVWARFVLVTSVLLFFRFSTLLTRSCNRTPVDKS
jgi:hypothetical protein